MGFLGLSNGDLRAYYLGILVCIGGFLFGYDTGVVGGTITLASYQHSFRYTDASDAKHTEVEALAVGLQQCGSFVGCVAIFPITSRWGRRIAMQLSALIFVLGAAVQTANTHHLSSFYIGRIVAGLGVGGASVIVPLYASEMSPAHLRGRIGSGYQFLFTWGIFCSYWCNYGVDKHISSSLEKQWQIPIAMQIIPGALLGLGMLTVPESARWLAARERHEEAMRALQWIRAAPEAEVQAEMSEIREVVEMEKAITRDSLKVELKSKTTLLRLGLSLAVMVGQVCTGANAIAYFSPQFFILVVGEGSEALLISGIFGAIKIVSCGIFVIFLAERIGRRLAFTGGAALMSVSLLCVAIIVKLLPPPGDGVVTGSGIGVVALIYFAIIVYNCSWGPLGWIYIAEVLSPKTRDLGVAVALCTQWIFNIVWSVATPYMIANLGWATFLIFAGVDACSAVFSWFFVKESMGKTLEEMEREFQTDGANALEQIQVQTKKEESLSSSHREDTSV